MSTIADAMEAALAARKQKPSTAEEAKNLHFLNREVSRSLQRQKGQRDRLRAKAAERREARDRDKSELESTNWEAVIRVLMDTNTGGLEDLQAYPEAAAIAKEMAAGKTEAELDEILKSVLSAMRQPCTSADADGLVHAVIGGHYTSIGDHVGTLAWVTTREEGYSLIINMIQVNGLRGHVFHNPCLVSYTEK